MKKKLFTFLFALASCGLFAQISVNKNPLSNRAELSLDIPAIIVSPPNLSDLMTEDNHNALKGKPYRYATFLDCSIDPTKDGVWETIDENVSVWRVRIQSEGALALALNYNAFWIPSNGEFYVYSPDKSKILGAYTNKNNHSSGVFANELIEGDELILEYVKKGNSNPIIHINKLMYAYRSVSSKQQARNFGDSGACHVNVNCSPEGDDWQDVKTSVCRISVRIGNNAYWCSGSLLNNTAEDCKPYVLTADHCAFDSDNDVYASQNDMNQWVFYFNYEADQCENPSSNPSSKTMSGCSFVSNSSENGNINNNSDFHLIELNNSLPFEYGLYVAGWNRNNSSSSQGVGIHHPAGDIKKISTYTQSANSANGGTDWRVRWAETSTDHSVTEGGSSGSPLLNSNKQVVGNLSTGSSACSPTFLLNGFDFYGKLSYSWDQNGNTPNRQLKPWLDPLNSGVTTMNAKLCGTSLIPNFEASHTHVQTGYSTQFFYTGLGNPESYNWTFYGVNVNPANSTETQPIVTYSNSGQYTVRLEVTEGDFTSSEIKSAYILVDENGSSIDITENQIEFNVFPNPSNGKIYISQNFLTNVHIEIINILGQPMLSEHMNDETKTIDISSLENGVYYIRVFNTLHSTTKPLIVRK